MRHGIIFLLPLFTLCFFLLEVNAQQIIPGNLEYGKRTNDGRYNFLKFKPTAPKSDTSTATIKRLLGLGNRHSLQIDKQSKISSPPENGQIKHSRYKQYFSGLRVEFGNLTIHSRAGVLDMLTGDYFNIPENFSVNPLLSESTALTRALAFIGASKYSWQDANFPDRSLNARPRGELVICKDFTEEQENNSTTPAMRLAFKFAIYAVQPLRYDHIYIDASTGKVLLVNPIIKHADGSAVTRYSGSRTISTSITTDGRYTLKDTVGNYNVATWNLNKGSNYLVASEFTDNDNNWTDAEFNNSNFDHVALDAHWGAMKTNDYFKLKHNRNSFDNNGARINSYVHYSVGYVNAFWNGSSMTYGDGDGIYYFPLTTLDICGHEIAHAVCEYSANLIYSYESGALNESLSDIWGACVEYFSDPQKNTWALGDECSVTGSPFRSMNNPNSQGQPDTYKGNYWYTGSADNGGVHYNSGVMNFWFYLLSVGQSGVNDFGIPFNVSGIGIDKAAAIVYRAETMYLFPSSTYIDARITTLQAAQDLYGVNSNEYIQAKKAWDAVGVKEFLPAPSALAGTINGNVSIRLNWTFNSSIPITAFAIERSINDTSNFQHIAFVDSGLRIFDDSNFVNNTFNNYRIRSVRADSVFSNYTTVARIPVGNAPLFMNEGTFTTCGITFLDPGGTGNYPNSASVSTVLKPFSTDTKIRARFSYFKTEEYLDYLYVYNGAGTNAFLGYYTGRNTPSTLQSTAPGGELTFYFYSNNSIPDSGWSAYISCYKPITATSGLTATYVSQLGTALQWNDLLSDETKFVIERSINDSLHFQTWRELPPNTTAYTDSTLAPYSVAYYRIVACWDKIESNYSNTVVSINGPVILMQNNTITTCEGLFMDAGGLGNNNAQGTQTLTLNPGEVGRKIKVSFTEFNMPNCCEYLRVYNGSSTNAPLIGSFNGTTLPPVLESTALEGQLTFQYSGYSTSYPGWKAIVNCYLPVAAPLSLMVEFINNKPRLSWIDQSSDETKFVIERSTNSPKRFEVIGEATANSTSFVDISAPANALCNYRVRAYRDTQGSPYSNVAELGIGNAPFLMKDSVLITCNKIFMDEGGVDMLGEANQVKTVTFKPSIAGNRVRVVFSNFRISYNSLYVFNGASVQSPQIGSYSGSNIPPVLDGTSADGSLTFYFYSSGSYNDSGWVAQVSCYKPVANPSGLQVNLNGSQKPALLWTDNADDETNYIIERSVNAPALFTPLANLTANSNSYVDTSAPANSLLVYRVKAQRDTFNSYYSDPVRINFGNAPFLMKDSTLIVCDKVFLDAGGTDLYPPDNYTRTVIFKPTVPGNRIRVRFHQFKTSSNLIVYNGSGVNQSPLLGSFYGNKIDSIFDGNGPEGSLTFVFQYSFGSDSGWQAYVSCYKPIPRPTTLQSAALAGRKVRLQWLDNSDDETGFIVERSVNAPSLYASIAQVPANNNLFIDSLVPDNAVVYYRIRAIRDTINSFYSDTTQQLIGNAPLIMKDTVAIACGKLFMDPGGVDVLPKGSIVYITTLRPTTPQHRVRVSFRSFKIGYYGYMAVFNGSGINAPLLTSVNGSSAPLTVLEGFNPDGSLTFYYNSNSQEDSGWVADISCYKTVARPTDLIVTYQAGQKPLLKWKDNADNETNYIVERSTNTPGRFISIANLGPNSALYNDTSAPGNSMLYYRIRASRDTLASFNSDTFQLTYGNAPYIMTDSSVLICDRTFMDPGGIENVPSFYTKSTTLKPLVPGGRVKVVFKKFHLPNGTLYVYKGSNIYGPLIGTFTGTGILPVFDGDGPDGSLTFVHYNGNPTDSGWEAAVTCYKPVAKPTIGKAISYGINQVRLTWKDNADDETKYIVERSVNSPTKFSLIAELPANASYFIDTNYVSNSFIHYRVLAVRDTLKSFYSDTAQFEIGNVPIVMKDTTVIACDRVFLDPGGIDLLPGNVPYSLITFKPLLPNQSLRLEFSKFKIGAQASLTIYDGSNYGTPVIGVYTDANLPTVVESSNADGSLSVYLQNYYGSRDSGWVAHLTCIQGVTKPTNLVAIKMPDSKVKLRWNDNSEDETSYVVERSLNSQTFQLYSELPSNTVEFVDTLPGSASILTYRVAAKRLNKISKYSEAMNVSMASDTIIMRNGSFAGCGFTFMDPGGLDQYPTNTDMVTTFYPPDNQSKVSITFSRFRLAEDYSDYFVVYDGNSINAPGVSWSRGTQIPPSYTSTAADGSLTFRLISNSNLIDSGWVATISCVRFPSLSNLRVSMLNSRIVKLNWNKADTTGLSISVERSIGGPEGFQRANWIYQYTDSSCIDDRAPMNSLIYYRVRLEGYPSGSSYSNQVYIRTYTCNNADNIIDKSTVQYFSTNGETSYYDSTCKLIAVAIPKGYEQALGNTKVSVKFYPNSISYNGQNFVKRHVEIYPDNGYTAMGKVKLYFTQEEFDNYNSLTNHSKLPANQYDVAAFENVVLYVFRGLSSDESLLPQSYIYASPVKILEDRNVTLNWNNQLNCWELTAQTNGFGGFFLSSKNDTVSICSETSALATNSIWSNTLGYAYYYQWQKLEGNTWINLTDGLDFTGTNTEVLSAKNYILGHGDQFRCNAGTDISKTYTINKTAYWAGNSSGEWNSGLNWKCGTIPHPNAAVVIESGRSYYPFINLHVGCRSLIVKPGAMVIVSSGYTIKIEK